MAPAVAVAMAVVAAAAVVALPGPASAVPADRGSPRSGDVPAYETDENAAKIRGTASSGDGPEIRPGTYTDTVGPGEKRYYRLELDGTSSAFVSAVAAPGPGARVDGIGEGLELKLESADGSTCTVPARPRFSAGGEAHPIADYATRIIGADDGCQKAGPYLFSVKRESASASDGARWPLEIRYMSEPGLKGGRRALPRAPGDLAGPRTAEATPAPVTGGETRRARGGNGFSDAGAVAEGVWKDRIRPGETRFYRVPVDWGQRLNASVELGSSPSPGEYPPTLYDGFGVTAYNPARGRFDDGDFVPYSPGKPAQAGVYTPPVRFGSRFDYTGNEPCVAGWHYLAVRVSPKLAGYFESTAPLTLRIDVIGKAEKAPEYAGDAKAAGFGVGEGDRQQAEKGRNAAEAGHSGALRVFGYSAVGAGTLLVLVMTAWWLTARRRAATEAGVGTGIAGTVGTALGTGPFGGSGERGEGSSTVPLRRDQGARNEGPAAP